MRILFLVQSLGMGGAVRQLSILSGHLARRGHDVSVVALYTTDQNWNSVWEIDSIPVKSFLLKPSSGALSSGLQLIKATIQLWNMIKREDIQVLYSYQGDIARFVAWLATRGIPNAKLIWGIQGSGQRNTLSVNDWRESLPFYLCKWVSASVHLMVSGSDAGYNSRKAKGYSCPKQIVIFHGIDTDRFLPDSQSRVRIRSEWGVTEDEKLIGRIARLAPDKGYPIFLEAAALLSKERKDVRFVIAGDGPESYKRQLQLLSQELGLAEHLIWAGARPDMPAVYNALDILCSSSDSEGFGLTVAEAMACGVPCVATDVGDSAKIVGDKGIVVPPGNPQMLADGLKTMLHRLHGINPLELRERIVSRFSIKRMVEATEKALSEVCSSYT